jgi:hypothetical protein
VREGPEAGGDHPRLGGVQVVDLDADVVERLTLAELGRRAVRRAIKREVAVVSADMDRAAAGCRGALPADLPAEQTLHEGRDPVGVADGDVHVLEAEGGHGEGLT